MHVGGTLALGGGASSGGYGPGTVHVDVTTGAAITTVWTPGHQPYEGFYCIYNIIDVELGCDSMGGIEPVGLAVTGVLLGEFDLSFELECGPVLPVPGDLDGDRDVDLGDFGIFAGCMMGPGVPHPGGCEAADLDGEGDVDLEDFAAFQRAYTGP